MERREFLHGTCLFCLGAGLGGLSAILSSCSSAPVYRAQVRAGRMEVPESLFERESVQVIRSAELTDDIALVRIGEGDFRAYVMRCTHADNPLSYRGTEFACSLHGSRFDTAGNVIHGPAVLPLRTLRTSIAGGVITIFV
ncbi:MAG TPA: Rieske (2Fe-2S) protein [Bacteroidota bacterium]|nr:Rieske (2Fe-2S) protein [Bacteroidota bacterium]